MELRRTGPGQAPYRMLDPRAAALPVARVCGPPCLRLRDGCWCIRVAGDGDAVVALAAVEALPDRGVRQRVRRPDRRRAGGCGARRIYGTS
jgi:hypothetical protein